MATVRRRSNTASGALNTLGAEDHGSSVVLSVSTLLKNMIGAGIFSLPLGLKLATPIPGLLILGCIGVMSAVSYWMVGYCCIAWRVASFRKVWARTIGEGTAWVIDLTILMNGWFTLVGYLVLIGDFTTKSFGGLLGEDHILARSRLLDQWAITLLVLMPLSLAEDLRRLAFTSVVGLGVTIYVVLLVLHDSWAHASPEWGPGVAVSEWRMGAFEAAVLYTHAFVAHYNAPKMFGELARPTPARWLAMVVAAYSIAFCVYASFSLAAFLRFQDAVEGNVLRNFTAQTSVLVAWLGMGFSIAFTYPMIFNSTREALINLMWVFTDEGGVMAVRGSGRRSPSAARPEAAASRRQIVLTSVVFVIMTALVASVVTDLGFVNALTGSIMGCSVAFVFPSMLFFRTVRAQLDGPWRRGDLDAPLLGTPDSTPAVSQVGRPNKRFFRAALVVASFVGVGGVALAALGLCVALGILGEPAH